MLGFVLLMVVGVLAQDSTTQYTYTGERPPPSNITGVNNATFDKVITYNSSLPCGACIRGGYFFCIENATDGGVIDGY